jgi:hypothetical protein
MTPKFIPDEVLANLPWNYFERRAFELSGYASTERFRQLKAECWRLPDALATIVPLWDRRADARCLHDEGPIEKLEQCRLFECPVSSFSQLFFKPEKLNVHELFDNVDCDKLLLVIDYWKSGIGVTPPFVLKYGNYLRHASGWHRIAAAFLVSTDTLPFWSPDRFDIE